MPEAECRAAGLSKASCANPRRMAAILSNYEWVLKSLLAARTACSINAREVNLNPVFGELTMADVDADLVLALKQAKSKKMFFAFIPKGSEGKLIISKKKIPPKLIAEAKKEIGGGTAVTGKCNGPFDEMTFQVVKACAPSVSAAIKKVAKRDTGLTIIPDIQLAGDADEDEEETGAAPEAAASAPAAPAPGAPTPGAPPAPAREIDLGPWQTARTNAINELKALAAKIASTRHGSAAGVLGEINTIIKQLPANPQQNELDKIEDFVRNDDTLAAVEEVPDEFHDADIREPLLKALEALKQ